MKIEEYLHICKMIAPGFIGAFFRLIIRVIHQSKDPWVIKTPIDTIWASKGYHGKRLVQDPLISSRLNYDIIRPNYYNCLFTSPK